MRRAGRLLVAGVVLGLTASVQAKAPVPTVQEEVTFTHSSWGATLERWRLAGGKVEYEKPKQPPFSNGPKDIEVKKFVLTAAQRRELNKRVASAAKTIGLPDECSNYIPDGPYGNLTWKVRGVEKKLNFTASCMEGSNAVKSKAGFGVGHYVSDIAKTKPVTDTREAD